MGPSNILAAAEEDYIITYILTMAKIGYPVSKPEVLDNIKNIINHNDQCVYGSQMLDSVELFEVESWSLTRRRYLYDYHSWSHSWFNDAIHYLNNAAPGELQDPSWICNADKSGFPLDAKNREDVRCYEYNIVPDINK